MVWEAPLAEVTSGSPSSKCEAEEKFYKQKIPKNNALKGTIVIHVVFRPFYKPGCHSHVLGNYFLEYLGKSGKTREIVNVIKL